MAVLVSFEVRLNMVRSNLRASGGVEEALPILLRDTRHYHDSNQALEAITLDPHFGDALVRTKTPLCSNLQAGQVRIFIGSGHFGFIHSAARPGNALVAMEAFFQRR